MKDKGFRENYQYIFAQDGMYGGDQNMPKRDPERYKEIVRRYYFDNTV